jgi:hypothetical protein
MSDFKGIIVSGGPVTTKHFVDAKIIKAPYECQHPESYIRPNDEGKRHCSLCGKVLPEN